MVYMKPKIRMVSDMSFDNEDRQIVRFLAWCVLFICTLLFMKFVLGALAVYFGLVLTAAGILLFYKDEKPKCCKSGCHNK
jgi:hypothetical protein